MVAVTENTPRVTLLIQGVQFDCPQPYTSGHPLTEGEASQLNQVLGENLRNNFASKVEAAKAEYRKANSLAEDASVSVDDLDTERLQADFDEYAAGYEFGIRRGGGSRLPADPVEREAYKIAEGLVKDALKKKGVTLESVSREKMQEYVSQLLASNPKIREVAKRRIDELNTIGLGEIAGAAAA